MHIQSLIQQPTARFSIELYPPKTDRGQQLLLEKLPAMTESKPVFFSVTYGAGGATHEGTNTLCALLKKTYQQEVVAHLTCIAHDRQVVIEQLKWLKQEAGIDKIMALRGDMPQWAHPSAPIKTAEDFIYAIDLVRYLKQHTSYNVLVAGYPEAHPETPDYAMCLQHQVEKINEGADAVISQFFTDNQRFLKWRDDLQAKGVQIPIIPGILPALSAEQITRFAALSQVHIHPPLLEKLVRFSDEPESAKQAGIDFAREQIIELKAEGVPLVHLYTLNNLSVIHVLKEVC